MMRLEDLPHELLVCISDLVATAVLSHVCRSLWWRLRHRHLSFAWVSPRPPPAHVGDWGGERVRSVRVGITEPPHHARVVVSPHPRALRPLTHVLAGAHWPGLDTLQVGARGLLIGDADLVGLRGGLQLLPALRVARWDLSHNQVTDAGLHALLRTLCGGGRLRDLELIVTSNRLVRPNVAPLGGVSATLERLALRLANNRCDRDDALADLVGGGPRDDGWPSPVAVSHRRTAGGAGDLGPGGRSRTR